MIIFESNLTTSGSIKNRLEPKIEPPLKMLVGETLFIIGSHRGPSQYSFGSIAGFEPITQIRSHLSSPLDWGVLPNIKKLSKAKSLDTSRHLWKKLQFSVLSNVNRFCAYLNKCLNVCQIGLFLGIGLNRIMKEKLKVSKVDYKGNLNNGLLIK